MRIRTLVSAVAAATLLTGLTAAPAAAGTSESTWCSDGVGYREIPVLTSPVTVGIEIGSPSGAGDQVLWICYSTSSVGQPGYVTGGAIAVRVVPSTGTAYPGGHVSLDCYRDFVAGVAPSCTLPNGAHVATGDVDVDTPNSSICLVSLGSGCVAYVPGVKLTSGADPRPLLSITLLGLPLTADAPQQCIAVVVTCP